jgi:hypothetical protein
MSVVTTQAEMVTSVVSTSNAGLLGGGLPDHPRDSTRMDGSAPIERRRNGGSGDSSMDVLTRLLAVVVLERLPVPSLAMARESIILFANTAFAETVDHPHERLAGPAFPETLHTVPRRRPQSHSVETSDRISEPV